jgi:hypothetical protein
VEVVIRGGCVV